MTHLRLDKKVVVDSRMLKIMADRSQVACTFTSLLAAAQHAYHCPDETCPDCMAVHCHDHRCIAQHHPDATPSTHLCCATRAGVGKREEPPAKMTRRDPPASMCTLWSMFRLRRPSGPIISRCMTCSTDVACALQYHHTSSQQLTQMASVILGMCS